MVFSSLFFIFVFLPVTLAVYYLLPRRWRNLWLFITSLVFYGFGEPVYIFLMLLSITVSYAGALLIDRFRENETGKKTILVLCIVIHLGLLGWFKYAGFAAEMLRKIPLFSFLSVPEVALPIGISFYTFQTLSYIIDVYRGRCAAQKNYISFGTYVSMFPQLIAGPIVCYVDIEQQLSGRKENMELFSDGVKLFLLGLGKKVLLANPMGSLWALLEAGTGNGPLGSWIGMFAYTLQIYFDFSGYSDMARGLGNMFGFRFLKNFDYPYISRSATEFWRRWHISLSSWFRDYLYIPLGGNRRGSGRTLLNLLIVWLLTGLWHGASLNFILWGLYYALILIAEKTFWLRCLEKLPRFVQHLYTILVFTVGWLIFSITDFVQMGQYFASLSDFTPGLIGAEALGNIVAYLPVMLAAIAFTMPWLRNLYFRVRTKKAAPALELAATILVLLLCTASLVSSSYNPFLYFRF